MNTRPRLLVLDDYEGRGEAVPTPQVGGTVEEVFDVFAAIVADQLENYLGGGIDPAEFLIP